MTHRTTATSRQYMKVRHLSERSAFPVSTDTYCIQRAASTERSSVEWGKGRRSPPALAPASDSRRALSTCMWSLPAESFHSKLTSLGGRAYPSCKSAPYSCCPVQRPNLPDHVVGTCPSQYSPRYVRAPAHRGLASIVVTEAVPLSFARSRACLSDQCTEETPHPHPCPADSPKPCPSRLRRGAVRTRKYLLPSRDLLPVITPVPARRRYIPCISSRPSPARNVESWTASTGSARSCGQTRMPRSMTIVPARRLYRLRHLCRPRSFCQLAIASMDGSRLRSRCPHARRAHRILAVAVAESNLFAFPCFPACLAVRGRVVTHPTLPALLDSHYDPPSRRRWGSILRCASFVLLAWPGSVSRGERIMRRRAEVQSSLTAVVGGLLVAWPFPPIHLALPDSLPDWPAVSPPAPPSWRTRAPWSTPTMMSAVRIHKVLAHVGSVLHGLRVSTCC